jgi:iron(III) transport system ATP-binding protein
MKEAKGILLKDLTKTFVTSKNTQVQAVKQVNLTIRPGEFVTLLGPSGCGKTTILRMIAGFETLTEGEVIIGNEDVSPLTPDKRDISMVFQNYALFPHMNVYNNIAYGLKLQKLPKKEIDERVNRILTMMKMEDFASRVPSQMSGGQQQRVSLARALVMEPAVLLFDEPLSNLDAKLRLHMRDEIRRIQQEVGITSIYVTHDQSEAMGLSDKVVIMKDGIIQQVGSPREIYQTPANAFVAGFIGRANIILGIIESKEVESTIVEVEGVEYRVPRATEREIGETIEMVLRPESITLGVEEFETQVIKSVFMGETHEYEVKWGDKTLQVCESNPFGKPSYGVGDKLMLGFDEKALHIL